MGLDEILNKFFDRYYTEADFVGKTYAELNKFGFDNDNAIACVSVCRDEITQPLIALIREKWGEAFNLSSLAGMFFAGKTGLMAAMHHSPIVDDKERYVFYVMPHIAIDSEGRMGICKRVGREGDSIACGALNAFQKELKSQELGATPPSPPLSKGGIKGGVIDNEDIEYSLIKIRLSKEIPSNTAPDLLELTKITQKAIQADLESALKTTVDINKSDYAVILGIQIHGHDGNYVSPVSCYAVLNGLRNEIKL